MSEAQTPAVAPGNVIVSAERLAELERIERELPTIIAKAKEDGIKEHNESRFKLLHDKQKENPEPNRKRVLSNYHKNKEEINARRREAYRKKKEVLATTASN
jgi:hypothetical protein